MTFLVNEQLDESSPTKGNGWRMKWSSKKNEIKSKRENFDGTTMTIVRVGELCERPRS